MKCLCNNEKDWVEAGAGALAATRVVGLALGLVRTANEISNGACACISSLTGEGLDSISRHFAPGRTVAFVGSSGVGKSTLLNVLAGEEWAATCEIQEWSGKGRHTTTSRELMMLPCGAMVVDTPGVKEIGIVGEAESRRSKRM